MDKPVMYRYSGMSLEQFAMFEENYNAHNNDIEFQAEVQYSFDVEHSILCCTITEKITDKANPLIKAELNSYFDIQPESMCALTNEGRIMFPPSLLVQFASLCYGSLRGVIFSKTSGTPLSKYVIPPVYFANTIDKGFSVDV